VARLEAQLGVPLFVRTTRRVALTSAGEVLVSGASAVLAAAADALERVQLAAEGRTGTLTVGFSTAAGGVGVVREILRTFAKGTPAVELRTVEHDFADLRPASSTAARRPRSSSARCPAKVSRH